MIRRFSLALALLAGCSFDTSLPEKPKAGRILGTIDTGGHLPLEGHIVVLTSDKADRRTEPTTADGAFTFPGLPPGLYLVSISLPGFARLSTDLLRVDPGADTDLGVLKPDWLQSTPQQATLRGKVSALTGGNVAGAKIEFILNGGPTPVAIAQVTVSADGLFVQQLPPGSFTIKASHPIYRSASVDLTLGPAEEKDLTAMPLVLDINPATLQGSVFKDRDGQEPVAAEGSDVTIVETGETTKVDPAGNYVLTGLAAGNFQVRFSAPGLHDSVPSRPVQLKPSMSIAMERVTLLLDRGTIIGTVKLADNGTVSGARVELTGNVGYAALVSPDATDPSTGNFLIPNVPAGQTWTVTARKDQYASANTTVVVTAGAPVSAGRLTLARLFGDFLIDDTDSSNTAGYTRALAVTLNFNGFPATGVADFRTSEDATFDGGAYGPYTGRIQPFSLSSGEGAHTIYAQYRDTNGQPSGSFSSTIVLDTLRPTTPVVTFEASGSAGMTRYINRAQDLVLRVASDDGSGSGMSLMRIGETINGAGDLTTIPVGYGINGQLRRLAAVDGIARAFVQVIDHAGNVSLVGTDVVTVDTQPPMGSIAIARGAQATSNGYTNNPLVTVNETWSDGDGGVVLIKLSNTLADIGAAVYQPVSAAAGWLLNPTGEGVKHVYANFRDAAGNEQALAGGAADDKTIIYDITPPTPASAALIGPSITRDAGLVLSFTTNTADLSTTQALTLSGEATFTSSSTVGPLPFPVSAQSAFTLSPGDGVRSVYVRLRDPAGNDALTSVSVTLDSRPPEGSFTLTGFLADGTPSATLTSSSAVTVNLVSGGAVEYRLSDASMTSCPVTGYTPLVASTIPSSPLPSGGVVTLCLRDAAGNTQGPLSQSLTLDTTAPPSCTLALGGRKTDGSVAPAGFTANLAVTASITGCTETPSELFLSSSAVSCIPSAALAWQPFVTVLQSVLTNGDGAKTVYGCVRDAARNTVALTAVSITLDTTGPNPVSATLVGATPTNARPISLTLSAFDTSGLGTTDGVTASEDAFFTGPTTVGPQVYPASNTLNFTLSTGDADKTVRVRFRDRVGNESFATVLVNYDGTTPTGSIVIQGALADLSASTALTATNLVTVQLSSTGANGYLLGSESLTTCPAGAGSYTALTTPSIGLTMASVTNPREVRICLRDLAGNVAGPFSDTIPFDATAPSNCTVGLTGRVFNGVTPPAGKTADLNVTAATTSCTEAPTDIFFSTSAIVCASTASYPWQSFAASLTTVLAGPDGTNTVYGCVRDATHNVANLIPGAIVLDRVGPTAPSVTIDNGNPYINLAQTVTRGGNLGSVSGSAVSAVQWTLSEDNTAFPAFGALVTNPNFPFLGTGVRTVYAKFRDDVGNESAIASDSIDLDVIAPVVTPTAWAFLPPPKARAGFTNDTNAVFSFTNPPADGVGVQIVAALSCTPGNFAGASPIAPNNPLSWTLPGADGNKFLCARVLDAAGNGSIPLPQITVALDTLPPTAPNITTAAALLNTTAVPAFPVTTAAAVTELNFDHYEKAGGNSPGWTNNLTTDLAIGTTSFGYTLQPDKANTLRLRAVDKAGNVSPEDSVTISWDNTRPIPVTLRDVWIDNGDGRSTFFWAPVPADTDVVAYKIYYGPVPGGLSAGPAFLPQGFTGSNAVQGASPITVAAVANATDQSLTLTGLTDGSLVYATVTALDAAGNESRAPVPGSMLTNFHVTLEPNQVSMNRIAQLTLTGAGVIEAISIQGDRAYVAGRNSVSCPSAGAATLTVVNLATLSSALSQGHPDPAQSTPTIVWGPTFFADSIPCTLQAPIRPLLVDVLANGTHLFLASGNFVRIFSLANVDVPLLVSTVVLANPVQAMNLIGDRLFITGDPQVVAINLRDLFDASAATFVSAADTIGTVLPGTAAPYWPTASTISRNRLFQYTYNGGITYDYLLDNALLAAPTFSTATASITVSNYLEGTPQVRPGVTGGNYLYFSDPASFSIFRLANLWNSTLSGPGLASTDLFRQIQTAGGQGMTVEGNQAFILSNNAVRTIDMTNGSAMVESSLNTFSGQIRSLAVYGDFMVAATGTIPDATLTFFELATPRSLHQVAGGAGGGPFAEVGPGFLYSGNGRVHDLHNNNNLAATAPVVDLPGSGSDDFLYDMVRMGDTMVTAQGGGFVLYDVSDANDRNFVTPWDINDTTTVLHWSAGTRVTGVEAWGNYLVVVEVRANGVWLEVYDARPILNPGMGVTFNATTHWKGQFQVLSLGSPSTSLWPNLSLRAGRAIIGLDDSVTAAPNPGLFIVDFRQLVDDVAGGGATFLGSLPLTGVRETVVRGGWLYAAGNSSVLTVDIKETMAEPPVALPGSPLGGSSPGSSDSIEVFGNHLFSIGRNGGSIKAIDVRSPTSPVVMSVLPISSTYFGGSTTLEPFVAKPYHRGLAVRGTRLYETGYDEVRIIELE